jgi:hypothetical protein
MMHTFIHLLTNPNFVMSAGIAWAVLSLFLVWFTGDWQWFSRAGSMITLAGAILAARMLLRLGIAGAYVAEHTIDGGQFVPTAAKATAVYEATLDAHAAGIGFWFIILGTLVWGYGDVFGLLRRGDAK